MTTIEFAYPLDEGGVISESEILQPFIVYKRVRKCNPNYYVLMPKLSESGLKDIFILTDKKGIRIYNKERDKRLYSRISKLVDRNFNTLSLVDRFTGEREVIERICKELIRNIKYKEVK